MTRIEQILAVLADLSPVDLDIRNDSHRHQGHAGDDGSGESHLHIRIVSAAFIGRSRLERHRMVMDRLHPVFAAGLHSVTVDAGVPPAGPQDASGRA